MAAIPPRSNPSSASQPELPSNTPPELTQFRSGSSTHRLGIGSGSRTAQNRMSGELRTGNGGLPIPNGPQGLVSHTGGPRPHGAFGGHGGGFDGPRSPPNNKNTSHVPCKFFKVGQCQAGKACPFSHSTDASKFEQPCKYFSKGNCKFGQKCALLHVLQNGRVVNRPNGSLGQLNLGGRVEPMPYHQESALGNSLAQEPAGAGQPFSQQIPFLPETEPGFLPPMGSQPFDIPQPSSSYNASRNENSTALSPPTHLSALDAPLPASFDSQGVSYMARHGPVAASVPTKFGVESPPPSLPKPTGMGNDTLRNLRDSAFGSTKGSNLGSSPSGFPSDNIGQRIMHSQRVTKPKMLSASLPRPTINEDWNNDDVLFSGEEDYLPGDLALLINDGKPSRRTSGKVDDPLSIRDSLTGNLTPTEFSSKVGSPSHASPSRFSGFFSKQKQDEEKNGIMSSSFGHVGSPLRNTSMHLGTSPSLRPTPRSTSSDMSFNLSSPPLTSSISGIAQGLQRTRLSRAESTESNSSGLHPIASRHISTSGRASMDRAVSSSSVHTNRIDEEQQEFVFPLDDDFNTSTKPSNSPWNPPKAVAGSLGSIGDGRRSLEVKDANGMRVPHKKAS